jgi:hypothetical protein
MVLTVSFVLSPVTGLVCHRHRRLSANLTPASGRQDHTTSPSAAGHVVSAPLRPSHPAPHVRDVRETPLLSRRDGGINKAASTKWGSEIFLRKGLDTKRADLPVGQNQRPLIVIRVSTMNDCSSWPGLTRPSTPCLEQIKKDVDARDKRGHDGASRLLRLNPGSSKNPPPRAWRCGFR